MDIKPGPATSSDHIPVIIKITTQAITTSIEPIPNYNLANWETFTQYIKEPHKNINTNAYMTTQQLHISLQQWTRAVTNSMKNNIPLKRTRTQQKPLTNNTIKYLKTYAKNITDESNYTGWTPLKYATLKRIRHAIIKECNNIQNKQWESKISKLINAHKNSKKFWSQIKRLQGNSKTSENYIIHNNEKIHDVRKQEEIF